MRHVSWFSCGATSAVMSKLALSLYPEVTIAYCDVLSDEHPDNQRFFDDIQDWLGVEILRLKNPNYESVDDVFAERRYMAGIHGAPCTVEMKKRVREAFQKPDDVHLFGFDVNENQRAERLLENMPELTCRFPLIELGLSKEDCLKTLLAEGIKLPVMYDLGYPNNNCLGCVKASSLTYWNKVRVDFPDVFAKRAAQEREYGVALNKKYIKGKRTKVFLDELDPEDGRGYKLPDLSCSILCHTVQSILDRAEA